jgi:hypothetical protein
MGAMVSSSASKRSQGAPAFARQIWREPTVLGSAGAFAPQSKRSAGSSAAGARVSEVMQQGWRSSGSPLQPALRQLLEPRFGDLAHVRVHADGGQRQRRRLQAQLLLPGRTMSSLVATDTSPTRAQVRHC